MAALGALRRMLRSGMIILAATLSGALANGAPDPRVTVVLAQPSDALGEDAVADEDSIAPGGATEDGVSLRPAPTEFQTIIQGTLSAVDLQALARGAARGAVLDSDTRVRALGAELDLGQEAVARMLEILGRQDVPPERLAEVLAEIVARHKVLLERVRLLEASEPRAAELRDAVAVAIEKGEYELVDALLAEPEAMEFGALRQLLAALDQRALKAMAIHAPSDAVTGTTLEYGNAADHGAPLHGGARAASEGPPQFIPSEGFCDRHPEHRLCERWADSSPLCDRLPNHPLCEDGGFCRRHPDHKRCEQPPSPS